MSDDLEAWLSAERSRVEEALLRVVGAASGSIGGRAAEPGRALAAAARYAIAAGGKRLRPILCVAGYRAIGGAPPEPVYRLAASLELIHTYSLIHDDLPSMDDDDVRRGRPSTHIAHGVATATLAGAALIPLAVRVAREAAGDLPLAPGVPMELVVTLCRAAGGGGMVGGQLLDLEAEGRAVSLAELERIHRLKTGALLTAAPLMGGMAAGARGVARDALRVYGSALGLAFQVADDILDVTGSSAVLGKRAGRDTELEKATFPALEGLDAARRRAAAEAETAVAALDAAAVASKELRALARYAVERDR
ncbi:MAG: polyprenyl synthetase family protein [Gemmatimonadota bacterium]